MKKLNKKAREGLEIYGAALVEYAEDFGMDDLADLFGEDAETEEMDDDEMREVNFLIGWITCLSEVMGRDPVELIEQGAPHGSGTVH